MTALVCSCGSDLFIECRRAGGWWKATIDGSGEIVDTDLDSLWTEPAPKMVRCAECGRRNPNPMRSEG